MAFTWAILGTQGHKVDPEHLELTQELRLENFSRDVMPTGQRGYGESQDLLWRHWP